MASTTQAALSPIMAIHARYEAGMAEYAAIEKAEHAVRAAGTDEAGSMNRALKACSSESDALRMAILHQVPASWAEAAILQYHISNAYDLLVTDEPVVSDDRDTLGTAIDTLFDFMCCEVKQDHAEIGSSFSQSAIRVHFARRDRTGNTEA